MHENDTLHQLWQHRFKHSLNITSTLILKQTGYTIVFQKWFENSAKVFVLSFCSRLCSFFARCTVNEHIVFQYNERIIQ